ncbi:MAG TPA: hypothetical protein VF635_03585 [Propionibacteriaceae bacterium]
MTTSDPCYRLIVAGPLSQTVAQLIDARFGLAVSVNPNGADTAVDFTADQPALRALLTLLWDFGHDLIAILECPHLPKPSGDLPTRSPEVWVSLTPTHPKERTP